VYQYACTKVLLLLQVQVDVSAEEAARVDAEVQVDGEPCLQQQLVAVNADLAAARLVAARTGEHMAKLLHVAREEGSRPVDSALLDQFLDSWTLIPEALKPMAFASHMGVLHHLLGCLFAPCDYNVSDADGDADADADT
jgi:hypothetical protein